MISAVADSCTVRLDKVNGKVYKFHALVFSQDAQGNNKAAYLDQKKETPTGPVTRSILSQQPKTEWKCAYDELLSGRKDVQRQSDDSLSGPIRKKSKPSEDSTDEPETKTERQRVRFKGVSDVSKIATSTCSTCKQIIVKQTEEYDALMEKSKEELVAMVMNLSLNLQNRRRKLGYCPSDKDIAQLRKQLNINKTEQIASKTRPTRTRRRLSSRKRLTSV